ncbi:hypothetical protein OEB99_09580 [Actinotalea sp. M2MS4P-6]|uniref:hypothetical protein n=1 Tax=Actinotalea sp. M2MS4P-6 TaxID=2983762 RepID=UPI0021E3A644|nr:hypothetical protein [Actinotalea sp. M2MS4P-6]MCV2394556.1 hypothetical protein [Actinotalea sp. M2MS4P-6]
MAEDEPEQVENRYRTAMSRALPSVERRADDVAAVFDDVQAAMRQGAWTSTSHAADDFASGCATHDTAAANAGGDCVADLRARRDGEPVTVPATDSRAYWG